MPNIIAIKRYLREDLRYPAGRQDVVGSCAYAGDLSGEDCEWLKENLPDKLYYSAEDVLKAISW
ncbi:TPA: hypothetical protein DF272_01670 [Candidatus Falkowbacteria bacterium]|nr:hypothetical protein [Candidatus Falkowbacteria bacterium]